MIKKNPSGARVMMPLNSIRYYHKSGTCARYYTIMLIQLNLLCVIANNFSSIIWLATYKMISDNYSCGFGITQSVVVLSCPKAKIGV